MEDYTIYKNRLCKEYDMEEIFFDILNSIVDAVCIYKTDGLPVYANISHMEHLGFVGDEFWQIPLEKMLQLEHPVVSKAVTMNVLKTKKPETDIVTYYRTNKTCLVSSTPFFLKSGEMLVTSIIRDLTELNALQSRVQETEILKESYRQRVKELEKKIVSITRPSSNSKVMADIYNQIDNISQISAPILLTGETGVGKDFLAQYIHKNSAAAQGPFIKINCGAIPENLLESELFGYEAGAFTGANRKGKAGLFEMANNGTLFLDEFGELPLGLQVKLLGVLQDHTVTRIGGTRPIRLNARIITATNANLEELIRHKQFRSDLYYRVNVISFHVPPLRERPEDILPMANYFLRDLMQQYNKKLTLDNSAIKALYSYSWPGNVRELRNTMERIAIFADKTITARDVENNLLQASSSAPVTTGASLLEEVRKAGEGLKEQLEQAERMIIQNALDANPTLADAARQLKIDISTLVRKKKKLGLAT